MEVRNTSRRGVNDSRGGGTIHGGMKEFTEGGKQFTEVRNNSRRGARRYQTIHRGMK